MQQDLIAPAAATPSDIKLREYQRECIDALTAWWAENDAGDHPVCELPTGSGKTIIFSGLIRAFLADVPDARVLVLAHRQELVEQAAAKLTRVWPNAPVGIWCAGLGERDARQVTIATRDSIAHRIEEVTELFGHYDLVIVDEAHNIGRDESARYRAILTHLHAANPRLRVVGFTATPFRADMGPIYGEEDHHLFTGVAYRRTIPQQIAGGYLSPMRAAAVRAQIDTEGVRTRAGDFVASELGERGSHRDLIERQLDEWQRHAADRRASVFFCASVLHAEAVSDALAARGIDAPNISVGRDSESMRARREVLEQFNAGNLPAVVNVSILTEGWDCERLDCVVLLRPTKSLGLFIQMVGRGLRLHPEKSDCLLLDFGGCLERFGPIDRATPPTPKGPPKARECPECETVNAADATECENCGHEFTKGAAIVKTCDRCGAMNYAAAVKCHACGEMFVKGQTHEASTANVFADQKREPDIRRFDVVGVTVEARTAKSSGKRYLRITLRCAPEGDLLNEDFGLLDTSSQFTINVHLGYPGRAGHRAERVASWFVKPEYRSMYPYDPDDFVTCHHGVPNGIVRTPEVCEVDVNSKWQDVTAIQFPGEGMIPVPQ